MTMKQSVLTNKVNRMGEVRYIDYSSKSILFIDLESCVSDHEIIDIGEKAKMLVNLGRRNKIYTLFNLTNVKFTRRIIINISKLMSNASLVERRVLFGLDSRHEEIAKKLIGFLNLERHTKYSRSYTDAINKLTDDEEWIEKRKEIIPVFEDRRKNVKTYTEEDFNGGGEGRLSKIEWKLEELNIDWDE